ncbi:MAG: hypothetical protein RI101_04390 [Nitrospira sp.]|jgi:hypothetical protein|nr:hypothetical protein [Nitrospira sp.]
MRRMVACAAVGRWLLSAVLVGVGGSVTASAGVAAAEPSRLQADADGLMKNVEEMMAHGGMGDAKAILHHCGEASRLAEGMLKQLAPADPGTQDARAALDEVIRQCRRVSERGVHADPGALLNPAIKARAAARDSIKALGLSRINRS